MSVPEWGCPHPHPEATTPSRFREALAGPYDHHGYDVLLAVDLLRFALDLPELRVQAFLEDGWNVTLSQSTVSRLSIEFLVRWRRWMEELLPPRISELGPLIVQIDGTKASGGPTTFRAREAQQGLTLWAEQLFEEEGL